MEYVLPHQHNTLFSTIFPFIFRGPLHFAFAFLAVHPGSRAARRHTRRTFFFVSIVDHKFCRRPVLLPIFCCLMSKLESYVDVDVYKTFIQRKKSGIESLDWDGTFYYCHRNILPRKASVKMGWGERKRIFSYNDLWTIKCRRQGWLLFFVVFKFFNLKMAFWWWKLILVVKT